MKAYNEWIISKFCMEKLANSRQFFNFQKCKKPHWTVVEGKLILETVNKKHQEFDKGTFANETEVGRTIYFKTVVKF